MDDVLANQVYFDLNSCFLQQPQQQSSSQDSVKDSKSTAESKPDELESFSSSGITSEEEEMENQQPVMLLRNDAPQLSSTSTATTIDKSFSKSFKTFAGKSRRFNDETSLPVKSQTFYYNS